MATENFTPASHNEAILRPQRFWKVPLGSNLYPEPSTDQRYYTKVQNFILEFEKIGDAFEFAQWCGGLVYDSIRDAHLESHAALQAAIERQRDWYESPAGIAYANDEDAVLREILSIDYPE